MSKVNARHPRHPIHPTLNKEGDQLARVTWGGEFQEELGKVALAQLAPQVNESKSS